MANSGHPKLSLMLLLWHTLYLKHLTNIQTTSWINRDRLSYLLDMVHVTLCFKPFIRVQNYH